MGNIFKRYKNNKDKNKDNNTSDISKDTANQSSNNNNTTESSPSFLGLAKNLAKSLVEWQQAGRPVVNAEQWKNRISICRGCEFWQEVGETQVARCKKCGCSSGKLLLATSRCPLNPPKWTSL